MSSTATRPSSHSVFAWSTGGSRRRRPGHRRHGARRPPSRPGSATPLRRAAPTPGRRGPGRRAGPSGRRRSAAPRSASRASAAPDRLATTWARSASAQRSRLAVRARRAACSCSTNVAARRPPAQRLDAERAAAGEQVEHRGPIEVDPAPEDAEQRLLDAVGRRPHEPAARRLEPPPLGAAGDHSHRPPLTDSGGLSKLGIVA